MEEFKHRRKKIEFWQITGEVLGSNKYSETNISSATTTIYSSIVTNHEFWIKCKNGLEHDIQLRGINIPLRPGQNITLIVGRRKGSTGGCYILLVNHNAEKWWSIKTAKELKKEFKLERSSGVSLLFTLTIAVVILIGVVTKAFFSWSSDSSAYFDPTSSVKTGFWLATAFIIYRVIIKSLRVFILNKRLKKHLSSLAQYTFTNY